MIGIGIGTHRRRFSDADGALAYFNAVIANGGDLTDREKDAYTVYRVDSEENANAWNSDTHIDYPMLGSTVESMVINAQNPGTFDAIAVNTVAGDFTANGFAPNGVNSYFRMGLIPSVTLIRFSAAFEYYSRTNILDAGTCEMGVNSAVNKDLLFVIEFSDGLETALRMWDGTDIVLFDTDNSQGGFTGSRTSQTDVRIFRNGGELAISVLSATSDRPDDEVYLAARNRADLGTVTLFSTKQNAGAGIYDGLTPAKVLAQYNARQLMNINCVIGGREV